MSWDGTKLCLKKLIVHAGTSTMAISIRIFIRTYTHKLFRQVTTNINRYMKKTDGKTQAETNYGDRWRDLGRSMDLPICTDTETDRAYSSI